MNMKNLYYKDSRSKKVKRLKDMRPGVVVELVLSGLAEMEQLCEEYGLDPAIVRDIFDVDEMPRIEEEDGKVYVFYRAVSEIDSLRATQPVLMVVGSKALWVISTGKLGFIDSFLQKPDVYTTKKTRSSIKLILEMLSQYQQSVQVFSKQIWQVGRDISKVRYKEVNRFVQLELAFNDYLNALQATGELLEVLLSGKYLKLYELDRDLVEDVVIATEQLQDTLKTRVRLMVNIREAYSTMITNRLNKTMKLLTAVTVILTLPTMVFSFYGMNVRLPMEGNPLAVEWILAGTVGLSLGLGIVFWKKDLF
jgi:magnesium transporter